MLKGLEHRAIRGKCCHGSPDCALNKITKKVDYIFKKYDRDRDGAKDMLDNAFLELEEENDMKQLLINKLHVDLHEARNKKVSP
jgi:hypothetical protein